MADKPTKRRARVIPGADTPPLSPPPFPLRTDGPAESERQSITLKLGTNGEPLWEKHTAGVLNVWKQILLHEKTRQAFGVTPGAPLVAVPDALEDKAVDGFYALFGQFQALAFSTLFKLPFSECAKLCEFSEEERAKLVTPTQKLLAKYGTVLTSKYADEINLLMLLGAGTMQRFMLCKVLAKMKADQNLSGDEVRVEEAAEPFEVSGQEDGSVSAVQPAGSA